MKESQFIGTLMPSRPDFQPIIQEIRKKYQLPEVDPDGKAITKILIITCPRARIAHSMQRRSKKQETGESQSLVSTSLV